MEMENGTVKAREMVHTKDKASTKSSHNQSSSQHTSNHEAHEKLVMESSKNTTSDTNPMLDTGDSYTVVVTNKVVERLSDPEVATRVKVARSFEKIKCTRNTCTAYLAVAATSVVFLLLIIIFQPSLFCWSCSNSTDAVCLTPECVQTAASLLAAMDRTADPCHDFFQYACGSWNKEHTIPEDKSSTSTFEVLADKLQKILKRLLEAERNEEDNNVTMMAKNLYRSCKNLSMIMQIGDKPLRDAIQMFGGWPVLDPDWEPPGSLEKVLAGIRTLYNVDILIALWVGPDDRNSQDNIIQIDQTQLGLPSRDYFLQPRSKRDLDAYHRYMTQVAILVGANESDAKDQLWEVILFEQQLANVSVAEDDRQDTGRIYTKITIDDLSASVRQIDWLSFFNSAIPIEINGTERLVSYSMPFFVELGKIIERTDKKVLYNYIVWRLVMSAMPFLPPKYQLPRTEFRRVLLGVLKERERWVSCVEWTNKKMGMSVGSMFIKDHFNQESKQIALEMIHDLREAFNELLDENHWMDEETRLVAKDKANSMNERIGYPEYIMNISSLALDYKNLNISPTNFLENIFSFERLKATKNFEKLRNPVSKDRWSTEPAVVNAFYNPNKNDIVFPAGILQPLFYSKDFPKSLNYGGIGVVIGHEITHGFDDKGRQFDKHGNLKQWWNNETIKRFRTQAQCMVDQYSKYKLDQIDLPINGRMTQGENIADNGGLKQAYRAYRKWVEQHGAEVPLPGLCLTHEQVFFLNYAQIWCGSMRPEDALTRVRSAVHSPGPIRVIGPLSNSVEFAVAYQCKPGSRMNPVQKCSVW